jgi:heme o synthase
MTTNRDNRVQEMSAALLDLARIRIAVMVVISCAVGFVLAYKGRFDLMHFACASIGTGLLSSGSCAINCYIERDLDAMMPRTAQRPIPAGVISPRSALLFGVFLIVSGALMLQAVNTLSTCLGLAAAVIYLGLYTPAKRWTWLNTSIGAVPGAIPPLIGWAAASGTIGLGGWILFAMLFIWQHTHFLPIAWLFRDDYRAAGFKMLPALENSGEKTFWLTIATAILLVPLSATLYWSNNPLAGPAYALASVIGGLTLIASSIKWWKNRSRAGARMVLFVSLLYLPALLVAVIVDRVWRWT